MSPPALRSCRVRPVSWEAPGDLWVRRDSSLPCALLHSRGYSPLSAWRLTRGFARILREAAGTYFLPSVLIGLLCSLVFLLGMRMLGGANKE